MQETEELKKQILENIPEKFRDSVEKAITYASEYHKETLRYSGNPMIYHLLKLGLLTTQKELDTNSTIAAILHEIPLTEKGEDIRKYFGDEIYGILERIENIRRATSSQETDPDIIIKYILASSKDLRPVIIKILDTQEDMRSIQHVPEEERKVALNKALNIYSVLAEYLFYDDVKKEIDENAFRVYRPLEYESISKRLEDDGINQNLLQKYLERITETIAPLQFKTEIKGRIKSKYSIYNKLKKYEKEWISPNLKSILDLIAFRIIADDKDSCFKILEVLMDQEGIEIDEEEFDDYISNPKPNGYKAIQFPIKFPSLMDMYIEIQILTEDMYLHNTYGPASHIAYKASKSRYAKPTNQYDWVQDISQRIEQVKKLRDEYIDLPIKCNMFEDEVFTFTPKDKIINMDKKDTVLDFAFKLHTELGNKAVTALVNGKPAKLSHTPQTGDVIEIKTDNNKTHQKTEALLLVNSNSSKIKIRQNLSKGNIK